MKDKIIKTMLFTFAIVIFCGCQKIIPDLPRDNPNDKVGVYFSRVVVSSNSGKITPGATVYLQVYVCNNTNKRKDDVRIRFDFGDSTGISYDGCFAGALTCGNISPFSESLGVCTYEDNFSLKLIINPYTPPGTIYTINMSITDNGYKVVSGAKGEEWLDSFQLEVE